MDGFLKLDKMLDWQVANYPLRMSENTRLMALPGDDFVAELNRMAEEYHKSPAYIKRTSDARGR